MRLLWVFAIIGCLALGSRSLWAATPLSVTIGDLIPTIGDGYDIISGSPRARCIKFSAGDISSIGNAEDHTYAYAFNSSESFEKLLNVSGGASGGVGLFHTSFAASYLEQSKVSRYADYLLIKVDVKKSVSKLSSTNIKLSDAAAKAASDPSSFLQKCGSAVVVQTQAGASFVALYRFETSSSQAQHTLEASLSASYGVFGSGQVSSHFQDVVNSTNAKTEVTFDREGVTGDLPEEDPQKIVAYALHFPELANNGAGKIISIAVLPYGLVVGQGGFPELNQKIIDATVEKLDNLAQLYENALKLRGDLSYVKAHPDEFAPSAQPQATDFELVDATVDKIRAMANACSQGSGMCDPTQVTVPDIRSPERVAWIQVDVTALNGSVIGTVPDGEKRVLEVRGRWNCRTGPPACWFDASNSTSYRVRRVTDGAIVERGSISTGTVLISHAGRVEVWVNDGPGVPQFLDNQFDPAHPVQATLW